MIIGAMMNLDRHNRTKRRARRGQHPSPISGVRLRIGRSPVMGMRTKNKKSCLTSQSSNFQNYHFVQFSNTTNNSYY